MENLKKLGLPDTFCFAPYTNLDLDQDGRSNSVTNTDIFYYIKDNLPFSELIWEFGDEDKPDWVHVAIAKGRENEKNTKIAYREDGKTKYKKWDRD